MSKLYLQGGSDARRTALTARGHKNIFMDFLFNWGGGNVATGGVSCAMFHRGDTVVFEYHVKGTNSIRQVTFHKDGTYSESSL